MMIEPSPLDFDIRTPAAMLAWNAGFTRALPDEGPWLPFQSPRTNGTLWIAAQKDGGHPAPICWFMALNHPGVVKALELNPAPLSGPGLARYVLSSTTDLFAMLQRVYPLARDLDFSPILTFEELTNHLPQETEVERLTVQRIGQNLFREALMKRWDGRCPLTGITDTALLRASHIKPWAACNSSAERLASSNGLLLSALWDAAFDRGLISFTDAGEVIHAPALSDIARAQLTSSVLLPVDDAQATYLSHHRTSWGFS